MSMPIYLMFIRVLLSVEFCFTLKTYLKGAPFYNVSASRRSSIGFPEARFWTARKRRRAQGLLPHCRQTTHDLVCHTRNGTTPTAGYTGLIALGSMARVAFAAAPLSSNALAGLFRGAATC